MFAVGCHLSSSKGFAHMGREALSIGGDTFQFFLRNPRGGSAKEADPQDAALLREIMKEHHFPLILAHAPYTMNLCSAKEEVRAFGEEMMRDDLRRMELFPGSLYNFHPGSHSGQGAEEGIRLITESLNRILTSEMHTQVLLETMAGKGSELGGKFEELRAILDGVNFPEKLGVCLDTCHVHDAGYDLIGDLEGVLGTFDRVIGLDRLKAVHLNDSKNPCGSRKDRHEKLGEGCIGLDALKRLALSPPLRNLPFFLETPNELSGYRKEIRMVKAWRAGLRHRQVSEIAEEGEDGVRILVDRVWPRGLRKESAEISAWWKEIAPSMGLWEWSHLPERFPEFREMYLQELQHSEKALKRREEVRTLLKKGPVTLLYGDKDEEGNHVNVLEEWILREIEIPEGDS